MLHLLATGASNKAIGRELGLAGSTIESHLRAIRDKLEDAGTFIDYRNMRQLVVYAVLWTARPANHKEETDMSKADDDELSVEDINRIKSALIDAAPRLVAGPAVDPPAAVLTALSAALQHEFRNLNRQASRL